MQAMAIDCRNFDRGISFCSSRHLRYSQGGSLVSAPRDAGRCDGLLPIVVSRLAAWSLPAMPHRTWLQIGVDGGI